MLSSSQNTKAEDGDYYKPCTLTNFLSTTPLDDSSSHLPIRQQAWQAGLFKNVLKNTVSCVVRKPKDVLEVFLYIMVQFSGSISLGLLENGARSRAIMLECRYGKVPSLAFISAHMNILLKMIQVPSEIKPENTSQARMRTAEELPM